MQFKKKMFVKASLSPSKIMSNDNLGDVELYLFYFPGCKWQIIILVISLNFIVVKVWKGPLRGI